MTNGLVYLIDGVEHPVPLWETAANIWQLICFELLSGVSYDKD